MRRRLAWVAALAPAVALEVVEVRKGPDGVPLSRVLREVFHTDTPLGRAAFVGATAGTAVWLVPHILSAVEASSSAPRRSG